MYVYIDEAGNLDFGEHGTEFFALTGVVMRRPSSTSTHRKTDRRCAERLYPAAFSQLMEIAMAGEEGGVLPSRVIVVTDTLPVRRERAAVTKAVKLALHERAKDAFEYRILHHASRADLKLQVADYVSWCVYRLAARADRRSFSRVEPCVREIGELEGARG